MASAWPCATFWPGSTSRRVTGPEIGDSTLVAWSLSKSTTPAASTVLWKLVGATANRRTCCSWSAVSVMLLGVAAAACALSSGLPEQAASDSAPRVIAVAARKAPRRGRLVGMGVLGGGLLGEFGPLPPAAAERLVEGGGVGEARRLRLHQRDARLLIALLGAEQGEVGGVAGLVLALREVERALGGVKGGGVGLQPRRVLLDRGERVGDVLEGGEHGGEVLLARLDVGRLRAAFLVQQRAALEDRGGDRRAIGPEAGSGAEHMADLQRGRAGVAGELDVGQAVGGGEADRGVGGMQFGLRLQHVRALLDEGRGQADRQV